MNAPPDSLLDRFEQRYGRPPEWAASAPGRVNLIGEHTDYNGGLVLACAIDRVTWVVARARSDGQIRVWSEELRAEAVFDVAAPGRQGGFVDYIQGVAFAFGERGVALPGFDLAIASDVPLAAGLSSSAALQVACAAACGAAVGLECTDTELARIAHRSENGFVGVPCGVLDMLASALGQADRALRIDCRSLEVREVALPRGELALLLAHSGVERRLAGGADGYSKRVAECETALLAARNAALVAPDATGLSQLDASALERLEPLVTRDVLRRARHVLSENERVDAMCAALEGGDMAMAGQLLCESHASLRDDYAVSIPELDWLCELADSCDGVYGSRLVGAGFGGCSLHFVHPGGLDSLQAALESGFRRRFGRLPRVFAVRPAGGVTRLALPASRARG